MTTPSSAVSPSAVPAKVPATSKKTQNDTGLYAAVVAGITAVAALLAAFTTWLPLHWMQVVYIGVSLLLLVVIYFQGFQMPLSVATEEAIVVESQALSGEEQEEDPPENPDDANAAGGA